MSTASYPLRRRVGRKLLLGGALVAVVAVMVPVTRMAQAADEAPVVLTDDSVVRRGPYPNYQFQMHDNGPTVLAVAPAAGDDYDLNVVNRVDGFPIAQSAVRGDAVDFVVVPSQADFPNLALSARTTRVSGTHRARIQVTDGQNPFTVAEMPTRLKMKRGIFVTAQTFGTSVGHPLTLTLAGRYRGSSGELVAIPLSGTNDRANHTRHDAIASARFSGTTPAGITLPAPAAGTSSYLVVFINLSRDGDLVLNIS